MKKHVSLSIITLTKNRANLLDKCLASLKGQLIGTDEIVIIDNYSNDNTQFTIHKYKKILPTRVYKSGLSGFPNLYNFAISKSTNPLLVFLDDDCMVAPGFMARIRYKFREKQNFVLQGNTISLPRDNIFADISERHLANWFAVNTSAPNRLSIIDNRNVVIPKAFFRRYGMFSLSCASGSEDVELGLRYQRLGVPIIFDPVLVSYHHERTTLRGFLMQHGRIAESHAVLDSELPQDKRQHTINFRTARRHLITSLMLFGSYIGRGRLIDALKLPLVYALLLIVRIVAYTHGVRLRQHEQIRT